MINQTIIAYDKRYNFNRMEDILFQDGCEIYLHDEAEDKDYLIGCFSDEIEAGDELTILMINNVDSELRCRNPIEPM